MIELKQNEKRSTAIIAIFWIIFVIEILQTVSSYMQYRLVKSIQSNGIRDNAAIIANDNREAIVNLLYVFFFLLSAIFFILWFRRAFYNLHQMMDNLETRESAAAYSWFIPIYNLFKPYSIMKDLYKYTARILENHGRSEIHPLKSNFIGVWWALWIIQIIVNNIIMNVSQNSNSYSDIEDLTLYNMYSEFISIPLVLISLKVVYDYSKVESELHRIAYEIDNETEDLSKHIIT